VAFSKRVEDEWARLREALQVYTHWTGGVLPSTETFCLMFPSTHYHFLPSPALEVRIEVGELEPLGSSREIRTLVQERLAAARNEAQEKDRA
jgi:hypothetical protein